MFRAGASVAGFDSVSVLLAVASGQFRVGGQLGLSIREVEQSFRRCDGLLVTFYLKIETEWKLVQSHFDARDLPGRAPLLIDEGGRETERLKNCGEGLSVLYSRLFFPVVPDGGRASCEASLV